jgi:hypothetical protein
MKHPVFKKVTAEAALLISNSAAPALTFFVRLHTLL